MRAHGRGSDGYRGWRQSARAGAAKQRDSAGGIGHRASAIPIGSRRRTKKGCAMDAAVGRDAGGLRRARASTSSDLAGTWHEQLVRVVRRSAGGGGPRGQRDGAGHRGRTTGRPSSRTVLCKGFDERGVVFYTNYTSAKSHDLRVDARTRRPPSPGTPSTGRCTCAARSSGCRPRRRRRTGRAARAARSWGRGRRRSRPWCATAARSTTRWPRSPSAFADDEPVPVPPHWGGWRIVPEQVEFWQGRADRMHDRLRFVLDADRPHAGRCAASRPDRNHRRAPRRGAGG